MTPEDAFEQMIRKLIQGVPAAVTVLRLILTKKPECAM